MADGVTVRGPVLFCFFAPNVTIVEVVKKRIVERCNNLVVHLKDCPIIIEKDALESFISCNQSRGSLHGDQSQMTANDGYEPAGGRGGCSVRGMTHLRSETYNSQVLFLLIIGERYEHQFNDMVTANYNIHIQLATVHVHSFALRSYPLSDCKMMRSIQNRDEDEVTQSCQEIATDWSRLIAAQRSTDGVT